MSAPRNPNRFATPAEVEALRRHHARAALEALSAEAKSAALAAAEVGDQLGEIVALAWLLEAGADLRGLV
ncbi:hypothetical protein THIX_70138 [Thiomonas sp. X19]|uniref:hypothetical protein n=1 Tax=Thiomonas sp. X19 TaxID=1050370 RepID=UPI000B6F62A3|nr:hypothetical protein [Thiomonas sp. X19]SCC95109.1 hypothetical protein THIX_70138 [Thiomonas sp. X19]